MSQGGAQVMDQALLPLIQLLVLSWLGGRRCSCDGAGHDDGHWAYCSPHPGLCSYHKEPLLAWEITSKKGAMKEELLGSLCSGSNGWGWGGSEICAQSRCAAVLLPSQNRNEIIKLIA